MTPLPDAPEPATPVESAVGLFEEAGFQQARKAARWWRELWSQLGAESPFRVFWDETWSDLGTSADPDLALAQLLRWIEGDTSPDGDRAYGAEGSRARRWASSRMFRTGFLRLASLSPALGEYLLSAWNVFRPGSWQAGWETRKSLFRRVHGATRGQNSREFLSTVRRFKMDQVLRIAYLDCCDDLPVHQVTQQISILADSLVACCLEQATEETCRRMDYLPPDGGFCVFALGKLGGDELNYSSDIDLNFVYDESFHELERSDGRKMRDEMEIELFFTRVAERLISVITKFVDEGQLYRLDARLRPEGRSGRLVWSARATINYYYSTGRAWERQALIRMRPVAGDLRLATRLLAELEGFIFPKTLSFEEVAEVRDLKLQMERIVTDRGERDTQVKIGQGGIRDVEYIVQYLQLIHGSRVPALRVANIFEALEVLEREGLLNTEETDVLRQGYRFLRRVEHRLQLAHLLQTHRLPDDPVELRRLARGLGFETVPQFRAALSRHAAAIRRVYELRFAHATEISSPDEELTVLLDLPPETTGHRGASLLKPYGFQNPEEAFRRLQLLAGQSSAGADATFARDVLHRLVPKLVGEISRQPEPDRALANFEACVVTLGARAVFYQLLDESPDMLKLFVDIAARSTLIVEILRTYPYIFDEIVDCMLTGYTFGRDALVEKANLLARSPDFEKEILTFKYMHLLLTAIRDLEGITHLRATVRQISDIAEAVLHAVIERCLRNAEKKFGPWRGPAPKILVLGLGKLGGQEMSYRSDIDLVFLYEGTGAAEDGTGVREYCEKLSQSVLAACKAADALGPLLHVDVRLRPLGSHNSLVISSREWRDYFLQGSGETWERQAFLRARPVHGSEGVAREALAFIHNSLVLGGAAGPRDADVLRRDIWEMRQRLEHNAHPDDLKRGAGGIMDVEFLAQGLQLLHGKAYPEILVPNTGEAVHRMLNAGLLSPLEASELFDCYRFLRWVENRFALVSEPGQSLANIEDAQLESVLQKIGYRSSGEESAAEIFQDEVRYHRGVARRLLRKVLRVG